VFAFAVQITTAAFTAILTLVLVRVLEPQGYGLFALALAVVGFVALPSDFGISASAARFVAEHRDDAPAVARVLADALKLKIIGAGLVSAALFIAAEPIASAYDEPALTWPLRAIGISLFAESVLMLLTRAFVAQGKNVWNLRIVFSESALEMVASVALVLLGTGAAGAAFGRAIGYAFGVVVALVMVVRLYGGAVLSLRRSSGRMREIASYAGPLVIVDGAWTAFSKIHTLLIGGLLGTVTVGLFNAPLRLITFLQYPGIAISNSVSPAMARVHDREPNSAAFVRSIRYLVVLQAIIVAPIIVWAQPIVDLLLGADYRDSANALRALTPYIFLSALAPVVSIAANFLGEARARVPITVATLVINLVLGILLIPPFEMVGAAAAMDISFALYVPAHFWICRRRIEFPLRPIVATVVRSVCAGAAMAGVLLAFGRDDLSFVDWVAGGTLGTLAFAGVLVATGELDPATLKVRKLVSRKPARAEGGP
jgi:O-antigen/teichoic acid export membrane protein